MQTSDSLETLSRLEKGIEAGWLVAAMLIPLLTFHESSMLGWIQMPKIFIARSLACYLVIMMIVWWVVHPSLRSESQAFGWGRTAFRSVAGHPARYVVLAAAAIAISTIISVAFSPVRSIGLTGIDTGWDTYGLVGIATYLVFFMAIIRHMRTADQIRRLFWVTATTASLVSIYAIVQHFGFDPFLSSPEPALRAYGSFGNPIFLGSYLVLSLPLTIALILIYRDKMEASLHIWIGAAMISLQVMALVFSLSRGPWVGALVGAGSFLVLGLWIWGIKAMVRPLLILLVAFGVAYLGTLLPVSGGDASQVIGERVGSIGRDVTGGLNNRLTIWSTSQDVFFDIPWVDTERYPEIPELSARALRPLVGYGPDMFQFVYPLVGESTYTFELASHGHNFAIHTLIELGLLGVIAYGALALSVGALLFRMLRVAKSGSYPYWVAALLVGLAAAFAGRLVEQIPGKAQIADLTLAWMLAALVAVLASNSFTQIDPPSTDPPSTAKRAGNNTRVSAQSQRMSFSPIRVITVAVAGLLILVLWTQIVVDPVRASFASMQAKSDPSVQSSIERHRKAVSINPASVVSQLALAETLFKGVALSPDEQEQIAWLNEAQSVAENIIARNPLDHRAWSRIAEYTRELGANGIIDKQESTYGAEVLAGLMPGFYQATTGLAWAYARLGFFEQSLEAVGRAKELVASDPDRSELYLIDFVKALALRGLGDREGAIEAAKRSMMLTANTGSCGILMSYNETEFLDGLGLRC